MSKNVLTDEQEHGIKEAGSILKRVFPKDTLRVCFNIAKNFDNVNYNFKMSGIMALEKKT